MHLVVLTVHICEHNCVVLFVLKTKIASYSTSRIEQYDALWVVYTTD